MAKAAPKKESPAPAKATPAKAAARVPAQPAAPPAAVPRAPAKKAVAKAPVKPVLKRGEPVVPIRKPGGDFDAKFLAAQLQLLIDERRSLVGQAESLEGEAASLMEDLDPGDVQFDDESGEGDSLIVERDRDLALSQQARGLVADIDAALIRIETGIYGYSRMSGKPIPKERLRAIPWATELVEEKVGGLGSR